MLKRSLVISLLAIVALIVGLDVDAQLPVPGRGAPNGRPQITLLASTASIEFPAKTDSNSPAFWSERDGAQQLFVVNSYRTPAVSAGSRPGRLTVLSAAAFDNEMEWGRWMEAVVPDVDGTLYGYYHTEPEGACAGYGVAVPQIGAARSNDNGLTWTDLGIILEAPAGTEDCDTPNFYFAGGVGDFSVMLDPDASHLYIFYSTYSARFREQGVAVARMRWSDRDSPRGQVAVWREGAWVEPVFDDEAQDYWFPAATPVFRAIGSWHDRFGRVNAFWGPSVHWNTYLEEYVMLLNRAIDPAWRQEGIYAAFSPSLENPAEWSRAYRILRGGSWYPQVIGIEPGLGTDRLAGKTAWFFMGGRSEHLIVFGRQPRPLDEREALTPTIR
jgi:hypothetical protein